MKHITTRSLPLLATLICVPGCLVTQSGSLEVLNPRQAYGRSMAIISDFYRENEAIERRLASDIQQAFSKRGLNVADTPAEADLVVVPTLGRMRERAPAPMEPVGQTAPVDVTEPVVQAAIPGARSFDRLSSVSNMPRGDRLSRVSQPMARMPASAQQAGLLLTAYRAEDYGDFGVGRQSLPPVWRIYVSHPGVRMNWNSLAVPLINAAANAAIPLGKAQSAERKTKKEEPAAEQTEAREKKKKDQKPSEANRR